MPSTWRVHVLARRLRDEGIQATVDEEDVYSLDSERRTAVVTALIAERTNFPMVVVDGVVVCHDGVDADAVVRALQGVRPDGGCC
jgi:predicted thioredoxin/glutaredoxin